MKLELYQIIIVAIALIHIVDRSIKFAKHEQRQSMLKYVVLIGVWAAVLLLIIFPDSAHFISKKLGMGENLNTLIFIGFIVVFAIIYKLITIIERMEKEIIEIVRKDALRELEKKK